MNYIAEINSFNNWLLENPLNSSEQALWYRLMAYANQLGWKSEFSIANTRLCDDLRVTRQHLDKCRSTLINKGLLSYKKGNGNQCGIYHLNSLVSVDTVVDTVVDTPIDTVAAQPCQGSLPLNKLNKTKQNIKKVSKGAATFDEIINAYTENETLRFELKEHLKTRKAKKATLTDRAIELACSSLDKLAKDDETKIAIVRQSIANGWTGFFALKVNYNVPQQQMDNDPDRIVKILQAAEKRGEF